MRQTKAKTENIEEKWYDDKAKLLSFASHLELKGAFPDIKEAIYFFSKPWKWNEEYQDLIMELDAHEGLTCYE